jgi:hypothetical protein
MEMGNPMVCMYLLGNPDHYTNYLFIGRLSYVREASRVWAREASNSDHVGTDSETIPDLNGNHYGCGATYKRKKIAPRKLKKKDPVNIETHEQDSSSIDSHLDAVLIVIWMLELLPCCK